MRPFSSSPPSAFLLLLLPLALFGPTLGGWSTVDKTCDSDGIIGTFAHDGALTSLTISPSNFTKDLRVNITKQGAGVGGGTASEILVHLKLDEDTECRDKLELGFTIRAWSDPNQQCVFKYTWLIADKKIQPVARPTMAPIEANYAAWYPASFGVRRDADGSYAMVLREPSNLAHELKNRAPKCFDLAGNATNFVVQVDKPATSTSRIDGTDCGVQLELKGRYLVNGMKVGGVSCSLECPGCSGGDASYSVAPPNSASTTAPNDDDDGGGGLPLWGIILIAVGALLLVLAVIGIPLVYFLVIKKKKKKAGAEEDGTHTAKELEPPATTTTTTTTGDGPATGEKSTYALNNDDASNAAAK